MRRMRWVLVASLALNLLLIGLIGGFALRVGPMAALTGGGPGLAGYARALPGEHRRALMREMRRAEDWSDQRAAMLAATVSLRQALHAEPFDRDAVRAALAEGRQAQAALGERAEGLLAARIEAMSPDERRALAARLERRRDR